MKLSQFHKKSMIFELHHGVKICMTASNAVTDQQHVSFSASLYCCSADVLCHCIIYCPLCRPIHAYPLLIGQVRVQPFALTEKGLRPGSTATDPTCDKLIRGEYTITAIPTHRYG